MAPKWMKVDRTLPRPVATPGSGPPEGVPGGALVARLLDTPRPHKRDLPFPRLNADGEPVGSFAFWVLQQEEVDLCISDAERYATAMMKRADGEPNQEAWRDLFNSAKLVEVVQRAARDNDDLSQPLFRSTDEMRHLLSDEEIVHLFEAYSAVQQSFGPLFRLLTGAELEEWTQAIADGADDFPFEQCSRAQLVALVLSFARLTRELRIGKSSSGSASAGGVTGIPSSSTTGERGE